MTDKEAEKLHNYLNAIMIIAEKMDTMEGDAFRQIAIDASNFVGKICGNEESNTEN